MDLGFSEILFLFGLGLLLFGPRKLPEIGRQIGRAMSEFKKASNEFQAQLNEEVAKLDIEEKSQNTTQNTIASPSSTQPQGTAARQLSTNAIRDEELNSGTASTENASEAVLNNSEHSANA